MEYNFQPPQLTNNPPRIGQDVITPDGPGIYLGPSDRATFPGKFVTVLMGDNCRVYELSAVRGMS